MECTHPFLHLSVHTYSHALITYIKACKFNEMYCYRRRRVKSGSVSRRKRLEDCRLLMQFIQDIVDVCILSVHVYTAPVTPCELRSLG